MKKNILIIGGFNSSIEYFNIFKETLIDCNFEYIDFNDCLNSHEIYTCLKVKLNKLKGKINVIAWSMGSMVFFENFIEFKEKIESITIISGMAKFVKATDYSFGTNSIILDLMIKKLKKDPNKMLEEFHLNSDNNMPFKPKSSINIDGLIYSLTYLKENDFRSTLKEIHCKTLIIHGNDDKIVNIKNGEFLYENIGTAKFLKINNCGHMPFTSEVVKEIKMHIFN